MTPTSIKIFSKIYPSWDFWFENMPSGNPCHVLTYPPTYLRKIRPCDYWLRLIAGKNLYFDAINLRILWANLPTPKTLMNLPKFLPPFKRTRTSDEPHIGMYLLGCAYVYQNLQRSDPRLVVEAWFSQVLHPGRKLHTQVYLCSPYYVNKTVLYLGTKVSAQVNNWDTVPLHFTDESQFFTYLGGNFYTRV
jgi:hypothetical protein